MDPYGLTLFSVEAWGLVLGVTGWGSLSAVGSSQVRAGATRSAPSCSSTLAIPP